MKLWNRSPREVVVAQPWELHQGSAVQGLLPLSNLGRGVRLGLCLHFAQPMIHLTRLITVQGNQPLMQTAKPCSDAHFESLATEKSTVHTQYMTLKQSKCAQEKVSFADIS